MARIGHFSSSLFLRAAFATTLLAGCGGDANSFPVVDNDGEVVIDASTTDTGGTLDFDIRPTDTGATGTDNPQVAFDRVTVNDVPVSRPDVVSPPADRPTTVCPSSCGSNADCNPCRSTGETGNYCCISGLCLYMTDMCSSTVPSDVPGGGTTSDGGDGGGGGGGDGGADAAGGLDASGGADAAGGFDAGGGTG